MRSVVIGTAGHIDHGKSALVLALTGTDPDRLKEEKVRGITIDLGFAHANIGGVEMAFVDVPGHERFVKNMLAGVGGIDLVLLVVAADESVMPQTREHFAICRLLGIPAGVIALTKADLVDADTIELARLEARELVAGSALANADIIAVSSKTGAGLDELRAALARVAERVPGRAASGAPRLPIDRVFSIRGFGTVVTGTLHVGQLAVDDEVVIMPGERPVKVRGVQIHGSSQPRVTAGHRTAVNLGGVEVADIARGATITVPDAYAETRRFDARLELLPDAAPLKHGARIRFHHGTTELLGRVALAAEAPFARIRLEAPAVLTRGDRFILRAYSPSTTIGGGEVLDPLPARTPIRTASATARFRRLAGGVHEAAAAVLDERGLSGATLTLLRQRLGLDATGVAALADTLESEHVAVRLGDALVPAAALDAQQRRLLDVIAAHHAAFPLSDGLPREEGRERLFARAAPGVFELAVDRLQHAGTVVGRERLRLAGKGVSLTPDEARARDVLDRTFLEAGLMPPDAVAAAGAAGIALAVADRVVKLLVRQRTLVKLDTLLFHASALERLKQDVMAMKAGGAAARVDVAAFKERYGISRKYAIPLLEWLDRERVTRRMGDARVVL